MQSAHCQDTLTGKCFLSSLHKLRTHQQHRVRVCVRAHEQREGHHTWSHKDEVLLPNVLFLSCSKQHCFLPPACPCTCELLSAVRRVACPRRACVSLLLHLQPLLPSDLEVGVCT